MANWVDLDPLNLLAGKPLVQAQTLAFWENPTALAEAASGAPKIADKTLLASGNPITISTLDDYSGMFINGYLPSIASTGRYVNVTLDIEFSTDGSTFSGPFSFITVIIAAGKNSYEISFTSFVDFSTGIVKTAATGANISSITMTGSSDAITDIRVSSPSYSLAILAVPQGGESAS